MGNEDYYDYEIMDWLAIIDIKRQYFCSQITF